MAKFCIFCGAPPTNKNKEHVVPQWLIKLTGDPKREAWFGFSISPDKPTKDRKFAFDQFTFPACEKCNDKYSSLELKTQKIIKTILQDAPITSEEATTLLDWFDKVRIGLWLGFNQLDNNVLDVEPNYYIERRIGQYDRLLISEKTDYIGKRLSFGGANTPAFAFTPSAFSLTINQYCFTNISFNFLFSRRIGFPFPDKIEMLPDRNEFMCNMMPARSRITKPLIQRSIKEQGTVIYQPMFPQSLYSEKSAEYDISYVKKYSLNFDCGVGKIMIETDLTHSRWLAVDEKFYLAPNKIQDANQHHIKLSINVLEWQNWLNKSSFSMEKLTPENRRYIRSRQNLAKRINEKLILNSEKIDMKMRARKTLHVQFNQKLS